jgi:hypothetical protein
VPWTPQVLAITLWSDDANPKGCYGAASPGISKLFSACGTERKFCAPDYRFKVWFHVDADLMPRPQPFTPPTVSIDLSFTDSRGASLFARKDSDSAPAYVAPGKPLRTSFGQVFTVRTSNPGTFSANLTMADPGTGITLAYNDSIACTVDPCM